MQISFSDEIRAAAPDLRVLVVEATVRNAYTPDALWCEITDACAELASMPMEAVNKRPAIAATRAAYKALGKDPNRYRPSAEALTRRAVKGLELYRTTALVDLINLLSLFKLSMSHSRPTKQSPMAPSPLLSSLLQPPP